MNRLEGRVAIVTGAASGIGKATAHRLADEGAAVLVTDIDVDGGAATVSEITGAGGRADFLRHDVTSEADWAAACSKAVEPVRRSRHPRQQRRHGRHQAHRGHDVWRSGTGRSPSTRPVSSSG